MKTTKSEQKRLAYEFGQALTQRRDYLRETYTRLANLRADGRHQEADALEKEALTKARFYPPQKGPS